MVTCHVCESIAGGEHGRVVLAGGEWIGYQLGDVPGWYVLATTTHVEGAAGLTAAQAQGLGPQLQRLCAAVQESCGADRVHVVYLGEGTLHCHFAVLGRRPGDPAVFDRAPFLRAVPENADPAAAEQARHDVRQILRTRTGAPC